MDNIELRMHYATRVSNHNDTRFKSLANNIARFKSVRRIELSRDTGSDTVDPAGCPVKSYTQKGEATPARSRLVDRDHSSPLAAKSQTPRSRRKTSGKFSNVATSVKKAPGHIKRARSRVTKDPNPPYKLTSHFSSDKGNFQKPSILPVFGESHREIQVPRSGMKQHKRSASDSDLQQLSEKIDETSFYKGDEMFAGMESTRHRYQSNVSNDLGESLEQRQLFTERYSEQVTSMSYAVSTNLAPDCDGLKKTSYLKRRRLLSYNDSFLRSSLENNIQLGTIGQQTSASRATNTSSSELLQPYLMSSDKVTQFDTDETEQLSNTHSLESSQTPSGDILNDLTKSVERSDEYKNDKQDLSYSRFEAIENLARSDNVNSRSDVENTINTNRSEHSTPSERCVLHLVSSSMSQDQSQAYDNVLLKHEISQLRSIDARPRTNAATTCTTFICDNLARLAEQNKLVNLFRPLVAPATLKSATRGYWKLLVKIAPSDIVKASRTELSWSQARERRNIAKDKGELSFNIGSEEAQAELLAKPVPFGTFTLWTMEELNDFWICMRKTIGREQVGPLVNVCVRESVISADGSGVEVTICIFSFAEILSHMWLVMLVLSDRKVEKMPTQWCIPGRGPVIGMNGRPVKNQESGLKRWVCKKEGVYGEWAMENEEQRGQDRVIHEA